MYARFATFLLAEGEHAEADAIATRVEAVMKELKGFKSITFVADASIGEFGILSVWASTEDAISAGEVINARLQRELKDDYQPSSTLRTFEVLNLPGDRAR